MNEHRLQETCKCKMIKVLVRYRFMCGLIINKTYERIQWGEMINAMNRLLSSAGFSKSSMISIQSIVYCSGLLFFAFHPRNTDIQAASLIPIIEWKQFSMNEKQTRNKDL